MKYFIILTSVLSFLCPSAYSEIPPVKQHSVITILLSAVGDGDPDLISKKVNKSWHEFVSTHSVQNIEIKIETDDNHIYVYIASESADLLINNVRSFYDKFLQNIVNQKGVVWLDGPWLSTTTKINLRSLVVADDRLFIE